ARPEPAPQGWPRGPGRAEVRPDAVPDSGDRADYLCGRERHPALVRPAGELLHHEASRPRRVLHRRPVDRGLLAHDRPVAVRMTLREVIVSNAEQQEAK